LAGRPVFLAMSARIARSSPSSALASSPSA
jgi:hypothetical protein